MAGNDFASPPPTSMGEVSVYSFPPMFIVALHRLARLGKADRYSQNKRLLQFDIDNHAPMREKWVALADAERVSLIYWDPSEIRTVKRGT